MSLLPSGLVIMLWVPGRWAVQAGAGFLPACELMCEAVIRVKRLLHQQGSLGCKFGPVIGPTIDITSSWLE